MSMPSWSARVAHVWRRPWRTSRGSGLLGMGPVVLLLLADELTAEAIRLVGPAVGVAEREIQVLVSRPDQQPLLVLPSAPTPEHGDGDRVEAHDVGPLGLRQRLDAELVIDDRHLLRQHGRGTVEVEVPPGHAEALTPPAAGRGEEDPGGQVAARRDEVEETAQLVGAPRRRPRTPRRAHRRGSGSVGDVAGDSVPSQRVLQCGVQDRVHVSDGPSLQSRRLRSGRPALSPRWTGGGGRQRHGA